MNKETFDPQNYEEIYKEQDKNPISPPKSQESV